MHIHTYTYMYEPSTSEKMNLKEKKEGYMGRLKVRKRKGGCNYIII